MPEGVWKTPAELEDPELKKLAASLLETIMHSRVDSTAQKYTYMQAFLVLAIMGRAALQHLGDKSQKRLWKRLSMPLAGYIDCLVYYQLLSLLCRNCLSGPAKDASQAQEEERAYDPQYFSDVDG